MLWRSLHWRAAHSIRLCSHKQPPLRSFSLSACRSNFRPTHFLRQQVENPPGLQSTSRDPPKGYEKAFVEKIGQPQIRKQTLFVVFGSLFAFTFAVVNTEVETEWWQRRLKAMSHVWSTQSISSVDLQRAQESEVIKNLREWLSTIQGRTSEERGVVRHWLALAYASLAQPYANVSEGKRLCWKICLLNAGVYIAWKISRLKGPMSIRFMHNPLSGLSYTLLTSMFSHRSFMHLAFNCLALESFGSAAYHYLTKEQREKSPEILEHSSSYHFLAFFISAGLFSGLVSHVVAAKFQFPRLVAQLASSTNTLKKTDTWASAVAATSATAAKAAAPKVAVRDILPSLGASGAVYACVTMTALAFPESQVALFIPPSYPISIQYGVGGLVLMDIIGVMRGWRYLDHWAHLGGAAFGVVYYAYGPRFWRLLRDSSSA